MPDITILLVDDDENRRKRIRDDISNVTARGVDYIHPPALEEADAIFSTGIEMIFIDYDLQMSDENGTTRNYMGGTLLSKLREVNPSIPLVLLTRPDIYNQYPEALEAGEKADMMIFRRQLRRDSERLGRELNSLISGYGDLRDVPHDKRSWGKLLEILKADEAVEGFLVDADPPVGPDDRVRSELREFPEELIEDELEESTSDESRDTEDREESDAEDESNDDDALISMKRGWTEHDVSKWVIGTLFRFPGILYDNAFAATSLGIEPKSFLQSKKVRALFSDAAYCGIFHEYDNFYWSGKLRRIAMKLVGLIDPSQRLSEAVVSWLQDNEYKIEPAKCIVDEKPYADTICYIYKAPVKTRNSLVYFPDNRPSVMDRARVSLKAIRESNRVKKNLFRGSDRTYYERIRSG